MEAEQPPLEPFPFPVPRVLPEHAPVTERYFEARFFRPKSGLLKCEFPVDDQCILFHSNKLALVTLAPSHPVVQQRKQVLRVAYESCCLSSRVSGKHKKGGQTLKENTILCKLHCADGSSYCVFACMRSQLTEINERLADRPQLVVEKTWSDGYIAILLPFLRDYEKVRSKLLTFDALSRTESSSAEGAQPAPQADDAKQDEPGPKCSRQDEEETPEMEGNSAATKESA